MRRPRTACVTLLLTGVLLAALPGCTGDDAAAQRAWRTPAVPEPSAAAVSNIRDLSASAIVNRAVAATEGAASLRIRGNLAAKGKGYVLDVRYDATSGGGRITTDGQGLNILRIQRDVWFAGDEAFWRRAGGGAAVREFRGRYLKVPISDPRFASIVNYTYAARLIRTLLRSAGTFTKAATTGRMAGLPAISIVDHTRGYGGTIWVATAGPPYILRMQAAKDSAVSGSVDFLEYNERFTLAPPDPKRVVDAKDLASGS
jgi:hypothetical protein